MERLQTSNVSISNGSIKYPIGKSIFAVNLPLKLLRATVANADIGSLNSLHTFLKKCLYHMPVKLEQNRMVQNTRNFKLLDKKTGFITIFFTKSWLHFGRRFCSWNYCLMLYNYLKTTIFQCSKNYCTPTLVTRLKVAPNMGDPISLKENLPQP